MIQSNKIRFLGVSLVALAAAAGCAAESSDGDGNTTYPFGTGGAGTGGAVTGTGGYVTGTGGVVSGTGGVVSGSGGFVSGTGGVVSGSGGTTSTTVTCTNSGIKDGYYDNGTMCGPVWTASNKVGGADIPGTSIQPPCGGAGAECFTGSTICATGTSTIPANDAATNAYSGIMIGWNVAQDNMGGPQSTYAASGSGLTVNFTATGATGETRVIVQSGGTDYCATVTSGTAIPWASFKTNCWTGGTPQTPLPAGAPIKQMLLQINGTDAPQSVTAFCLNSVTNN